MNTHGQTLIVVIAASSILGQAAVLYWASGRWQIRQGTFFSVRVEPDFSKSDMGRAILGSFRRRVWLWALAMSVVYGASFWFGGPDAGLWRWGIISLTMIGNLTAFAKASGETRARARSRREPQLRTAALFTEEAEKSLGLAILDWLGILLPMIFPVMTAVLFILSWRQIPASKRRDMVMVGIAASMGLVSVVSCFALRFRARSSDWNPDPRSSRKYRTMLGFMTTSFVVFFNFVVCSLCFFDAVPLDRATKFRLVDVFVPTLLIGFPILFILIFGIRWWLKKNFSAESADPMPDRSWKWGYFYVNRDDPALVVPSRTGIRLSFNYARQQIWWLVIGPMIVTTIVLLFSHSLQPVRLPDAGEAIPLATSPTTAIINIAPPSSPALAVAQVTIKTRVNSKDGLTYVWIPPSTFQMGCSPDDSDCDSTRYPHFSEKPAHTVTITKGFWIGQTPVTQAAYMKVVGANPSQFKGNRLPVEGVSWDDAHAYCERVEMRLPTEAEYEYAARGGSPNARYGPVDQIAWYRANSGGTTHEVGQKQANGYGLYDMLGNVWEWVEDWNGPYNGASVVDPKGPPTATPDCLLKFFFCHQDRVMRGGSWAISAFFTRVSVHGGATPEFRGDSTHGFRCDGN